MRAMCPECKETTSFPSELEVSEIVECDQCSSELEVMAVEPLVLAVAPEPEEDWGE
jgi:alpha-aminoadipate carrier protein LysW